MRERGDILEGKNRRWKAARHFIVFYEERDEYGFVGAMITTDSRELNVAMRPHDFHTTDSEGKPYKISYKNSYLVKAKLFKLESWGRFKKVGQLTGRGISFVEKTIDDLSLESWEEYCERTKETKK